MTEYEHRSTDVEDTGPAGPQRQPGQVLAAAREQAGISFETMAEGLRLPKRQLAALEADDYASLPPPAYVRGYLRAYAREVGLDGDEIVALFDAGHGDLHDPDLHPAAPSGSTAAGGAGLPIGLAVIALVAIAGIGGWWWQGQPSTDAGGAGEATPAAETTARTGAAATDGDAGAGDGTGGSADGGAAGAAGSRTATPADGGAAGAAGSRTATPADESARDDRMTAAPDAESGAATSTSPEGDDTGPRGSEPESPADAGGDAPAVDVAALSTPDDEPDGQDEAAGEGTQATADTEATEGAGRDTTDTRAAAEREEGAAGTQPAEGGQQGAAGAQAAAGAEPEGDAAGTQVAEAEGEQQGGPETEETRQHESPDATSSPEEAATTAAAVGPDELVLEVDGRSWMEVYDAGDRELVYTLYLGSDPVRLRGWSPFDVFLGNSPAVTVTFNGQEVAKSAFTRSDNTARFLVDENGARRR